MKKSAFQEHFVLFYPTKKLLIIMKLALLLCIIGTLGISAATTYSQETKLSLDLNNASVTDLLKVIGEKSEFSFWYNSNILNNEKKITLKVKRMTVDKILDLALTDQHLSYSIKDKVILIYKPSAPTTEGNSTQQPTVTGVVTDGSTGEPLPGVSVVINGTTNGVVTDVNGRFTIAFTSTSDVLVFSYMGYNSEMAEIDNRTEVDVVLIPDIQKIEEVVVIGYGTQKKGDITSSIASVKQDEFVKGNVQDVGQLIQGKVAGLTISSVNGDPTANTQIRLRGNTTLTRGGSDNTVSNGNPLILIDNVPGDFNAVAPEDIESIDVLKDGSAAAIYGTQGTNGVILITTKRASGTNINTVEYSGYVSTQTIAKKLEMSTAADVRQQIADGYRTESYDLGSGTDWLDEITRTPISQGHNLTLRGGSEKTNYLINGNYKDLQGIFLKSNDKIGNFRADINHSMFNDKVKINVGASTRSIKFETTADGYSFTGYTYRNALIYNPTAPVKNEDGSWYEEVGAFNYDNPVSRLKECDGENSSNWSRINGSITIRPIKDLQLNALLSYSKYNEDRRYAETKNHISTLRYGKNGFVSNGTKEAIDRLAEFTANYTKTIGKHHFSLLGGYSYKYNWWHDFWINNVDYPTDAFGYYEIELGNGLTEANIDAKIGSSAGESNLIAFLSRATYSYDDKYLFMGSLRYEAASQLYGTKDPWGLFPAFSLGWRISKESFMQSLTFINDLKLRVGYGVTGTQPLYLYRGVAAMSYSGNFYSDGIWKQTLAPSRNPNPNLRWEEKKEKDVGFDYTLFNDRIGGTFDYYERKIDGLLMDYTVPVPPNLVATTLANVGEMENKGFEALINIVPVKKKDIVWTTSFNFSTNKNKLITLSNELYTNTAGYITAGYTGEPIQTYTHRLDVGGKIGNFYGFKVVDIDSAGRWIYEDKSGSRVNSEDFARVDSNKMVLGNGLPKYYAGWTNTFRYKNFDLSISMRGAFGFQILNFERMYLENTQTVTYNRLISAYDKVYGKAVLSKSEDLEFNSYYIEDGDYWKIDNITFGYNFKLNNNKYIKYARIYVSSLNTYTITKYKGIDPEVQMDGLEPGNDYRDKYPTTRTFTIGFNANF